MKKKLALLIFLSAVMALPAAMDQAHARKSLFGKKKSRNFVVNGQKTGFQKKGLKKYSKRKVKTGYLKRPTTFNVGSYGKMTFTDSRPLNVFTNGRISSGYLYQEGRIRNNNGRLYLRRMGYITFYDNGMIRTASLNGINYLRNIPRVRGRLSVRGSITFHDNGIPLYIYPADDVQIGKYLFARGRMLKFRNNGTVESGILAKDYVYKKKKGILKLRKKKKKFKAGRRYRFDEKGRIRK